MATDVVGYSRHIAEDEAGTLTGLKAARQDVLEPAIAARRGRLVKLMGDGALVEFASVVDALECAVTIQQGMKGRNAAAAGTPAVPRLQLRIGINLGDVIVESDPSGLEDIFGDGVNLAAR